MWHRFLLPVFGFQALITLSLDAQSATDSALSAWPRVVEAAARQDLASDGGHLWGARLDTVPLFLVRGSRVVMNADPHQAGYAHNGDGWWSGPLPGGVTPANTALSWAGRRWAMVMLPLPGDTLAAERLVLHERWHVIQPTVLPLPSYNQFGPEAAILDRPEGRVWMMLEWRALARAIESEPGSSAERGAIVDALGFRAARYAVADSAERTRERMLDLSEGLAEYTGWKLTGSPVSALVHALTVTAPSLPGWSRAFPYYTGPAYGLLLDRRSSGWRGRLTQTPDIEVLLASTLGPAGDTLVARLTGSAAMDALMRAAEVSGARYGLEQVRADEQARWLHHQQELARLMARFDTMPTLRIRPSAVSVSFDPNRSTPLGELGTVYGGFEWKAGEDARLVAPDGALVTADWKEIRVPLGQVAPASGVLTAPVHWSGEGWELSLPAGWIMQPVGASWLATVPEPQ